MSANVGYINSPSHRQIIPEVIWAQATDGGTWVTEVQIINLMGGSQVKDYFRPSGGVTRGPFKFMSTVEVRAKADFS